MRRLLIVGCGDVIRRVLPELSRTWSIIALVRTRDPLLSQFGVRQVQGDLDHRASLRRLGGIADAVIHSAPPSTNDPPSSSLDQRTRNLIAALRCGKSLPRRLIYISTSGVYGDAGGASVNETSRLNATSLRARRRVSAERQLRCFAQHTARGRLCHVSLLRAPGIYAANRLPLKRLEMKLPLFLPDEDIYTNHIHATDLGRACIAALHWGRANRTYNVVDNSMLTMGDWFDTLARVFDLPNAPRLSRGEVQVTVSPLQWSFLSESRRLTNSRLVFELGFKFRYPSVMTLMQEIEKERSCSG